MKSQWSDCNKCQWRATQDLHKPAIKKIRKRYVYASYMRRADSAEIKLLSSENRGIKYVLYAINIFTKYAWVKPLKEKTH